jgi:hypothetical protein
MAHNTPNRKRKDIQKVYAKRFLTRQAEQMRSLSKVKVSSKIEKVEFNQEIELMPERNEATISEYHDRLKYAQKAIKQYKGIKKPFKNFYPHHVNREKFTFFR